MADAASRSRPPLSGITLLDLAGMGPSARCVRVLVDLGARWIRFVPPASAGRYRQAWHTYGAYRGAERIQLDLKHPRGREVFLRFAERADVIVDAFRPGVMDGLGVGYEAVRAINPRIVFCAPSGYGADGPYARAVGHDINYQAVSGALASAGRDARGLPALPGLTLADSAGGGWQAAARVLAALVARQAGGEGRFLDISAAEGVLQMMSVTIDQFLATGEPPSSHVVGGNYACYGTYATADGKAMAVGAVEPKFFANVCAVLGVPELAARQHDLAAQPALREAIAEAFAKRTRAQWLQAFDGVEACVTPVLAVEELPDDPHWRARGMFCEYEHPEHGRQRQLAPFAARDGAMRGAAPAEDETRCDALLAEFGYPGADIAALKAAGAVA